MYVGGQVLASATDLTHPSISSTSPVDNATGVAVDTNLVINADENLVANSGDLWIYKTSGGSLVETITITSGMVSGSTVTIDPTSDLEGNTEYYVMFSSNALDDTAGNYLPEIGSTLTWTFTTAASESFNCDPDSSMCTSDCGGMFTVAMGSWYYDGSYCTEATSWATVMPDSSCDYALPAGDGTCTSYSPSTEIICPSYDRHGASVTESDCVCYDGS